MTTPGSGNRWEPPAGSTPEEPKRRWTAPLSGLRLWLVGAAAAFLLLGGVGGFFIGHATAGHGPDVGRFGPLDHHGPRPGFGHDGSGQGDGGPR